MIKHYGKVALLMLLIAAIGLGSVLIPSAVGRQTAGKRIVTTTYPLYLAAVNLTDGIDGVTAANLTGTAAGCLHDYQLTPADRIALDQADLILLNGGGAEDFLSDVRSALGDAVYDTGVGIDFLREDEDDHDDHDGHHHDVNEHIWVSPSRYRQQVTAAAEALAALLPEKADVIRRNADTYRAKIDAVGERMRQARQTLAGTPCILFHESLAYLADELGLTVVASFSAEDESGIAAAALADVQRTLEQYPRTLVLYDSQYTRRYAAVDRLAAGRVLTVDTAVKGTGGAADWPDAMERNLAQLSAITEGTA